VNPAQNSAVPGHFADIGFEMDSERWALVVTAAEIMAMDRPRQKPETSARLLSRGEGNAAQRRRAIAR
jgi:hypothetical protein